VDDVLYLVGLGLDLMRPWEKVATQVRLAVVMAGKFTISDQVIPVNFTAIAWLGTDGDASIIS
jgi:hypothetical protein